MLSNLHRGDACSHSHHPKPVVHTKVDKCWPWEIWASQLGEAPVLTAACLPETIHYYIQVEICSDSNVLNRHTWRDEDFSGFNLLLSPVGLRFQWLLLSSSCSANGALRQPRWCFCGVQVTRVHVSVCMDCCRGRCCCCCRAADSSSHYSAENCGYAQGAWCAQISTVDLEEDCGWEPTGGGHKRPDGRQADSGVAVPCSPGRRLPPGWRSAPTPTHPPGSSRPAALSSLLLPWRTTTRVNFYFSREDRRHSLPGWYFICFKCSVSRGSRYEARQRSSAPGWPGSGVMRSEDQQTLFRTVWTTSPHLSHGARLTASQVVLVKRSPGVRWMLCYKRGRKAIMAHNHWHEYFNWKDLFEQDVLVLLCRKKCALFRTLYLMHSMWMLILL